MTMKNIKCIVLDIDGVCTDGKLYFDSEGKVSKCFNTQDGIAIKTALDHLKIVVAVITGRTDIGARTRMEGLGVVDFYSGHYSKLIPLEEIKNKYNFEWDEMAYIGDDWIDLAPMLKVGYPIAVANACKETKEAAKYVTQKNGGDGAVREAFEHIFELQGKSGAELAKYWIEL